MKHYALLPLIFLFSFATLAQQKSTALKVASYPLVQSQGFTQQRLLHGEVVKKHEAKLSFEFSGRIDAIFRDHGNIVTKGDVIAKQDTQLLEIEKEKLAANRQQTTAQLKLAELEQKRLSKLDKNNYAAEAQLDQVNTNILVLKSQLALLDANIKGIALKIEKAKLIAPFDGILANRSASNGEVVLAGTPIITLIEQANSEITVGVPLSLQNDIKNEMTVHINGNKHRATVISKGAKLDHLTRTFNVRLQLPPSVSVYSGQIAKLEIKHHIAETGFWVPLGAVNNGIRGTWQVYSINNQQLDPVPVNLLYSDGEYAYVTGALQSNQQIVANGLHKVSAHIDVQVVQQVAPRVL